MTLHLNEVDRLLAADFLEGVDELPVGLLRDKRTACRGAEAAISFARRVVQGQIDIVTAEVVRRTRGEGGDERQLVDQLSEILSAHPPPAALRSHLALPQMQALDAWPSMAIDLDDLFGGNYPSGEVDHLSGAELDVLLERLSAVEVQLSQRRHGLHAVIERLQAAIVDRHKSGDADVDSLLG